MVAQGRSRPPQHREQSRCEGYSLGYCVFSRSASVGESAQAFLVYHGCSFSKTHDLIALLAQCVNIDRTLSDLEADCRTLTSYGVAARHPDDLFEPGETDGRELVSTMRRLRARILTLLPQA